MKAIILLALALPFSAYSNEYYAFRCQGSINQACQSKPVTKKLKQNDQGLLEAKIDNFKMIADGSRFWISKDEILVTTSTETDELAFAHNDKHLLYGILIKK